MTPALAALLKEADDYVARGYYTSPERYATVMREQDEAVVRSAKLVGEQGVRIALMTQELERLQRWVNDLQSGMYINCVYCGHQYGPKENTPVSMADVLKAHIAVCPQHPMSALRRELDELQKEYDYAINTAHNSFSLVNTVCELYRKVLTDVQKIAPLGVPTYPECYRQIQALVAAGLEHAVSINRKGKSL